ncbi:MAG: DNA repair protein RecO [Deltaproteobacteria bacterium]|nr:DNA repair protein RecO [Deltaproteobacteria bacterium]
MASAAEQTTLALLAQSVDYGESDRVCTLLTREIGRVTAFARAARRSRRRFGGALGLFVVGEATLKSRRSGQMLSLERFVVTQDLSVALSRDVVKVAHASYMVELAREVWPEHQREPAIFELLVDALATLARLAPTATLLRAYEYRLLSLAGIVPILEQCARCGGSAIGEGLAINLQIGGVICRDCGPVGQPVSAALISYLGQLDRDELAQRAADQVDRDTAYTARELLQQVIHGHLGRELKTLKVIAQLRGQLSSDSSR